MSRISYRLYGETVYPFEPPSLRAWAKIVRRVRDSFPLSFPVRITRSCVAPDNTTTDSGGVWCWYEDGKPKRAHIWIHSAQQRAMAIDSLLHEWSHLMREEVDPHPEGLMPHDDAFWITFGQLYRAWLREG